jgi:uncharacterized phage protein (TIGR02218 family)
VTFAAFETSVESSQPIELYEITLGTATYYYTSAEDDMTVMSIDYVALPIKRGKLSQGPEEANRNVEIETTGSNVFVRKYIQSVPSERAKIVIKRLQRSDPQVITLFEGYVRSIAFSKNGRVATIAVTPAISAVSRTIPRYTYQGSCNHVLYGPGCDIPDTDPAFRYTGVVSAVDGAVVTVTGAGAFTDGWFNAGSAESLAGFDARLILSQVGDDITLLLPFPYDTIGQSIVLLAGCAHDIVTCKNKFNNVINYGGFAFVPTKNPFDTGIDPVKC